MSCLLIVKLCQTRTYGIDIKLVEYEKLTDFLVYGKLRFISPKTKIIPTPSFQYWKYTGGYTPKHHSCTAEISVSQRRTVSKLKQFVGFYFKLLAFLKLHQHWLTPISSVPDPDPYVFGHPGSKSGLVSHKYGSGSFLFLIKKFWADWNNGWKIKI